MTRRRKHEAPRRFWTADEDAVLRARFPHESTATTARVLGRTVASVNVRAYALRLGKTPVYLASPAACRLRRTGDAHPGQATQFRPGHEPANKGTRRPGWGPGRMKTTQFKPGVSSWRTMPIGSTRLIGGYVYRKVAAVQHVPGLSYVPYSVNWKLEHVLLWTSAHGPVPAGHALVFRNGDKADIRLDNLECITRRELMHRNSVHHLPKPLASTIQLLGALNRQIRRKERTYVTAAHD